MRQRMASSKLEDIDVRTLSRLGFNGHGGMDTISNSISNNLKSLGGCIHWAQHGMGLNNEMEY